MLSKQFTPTRRYTTIQEGEPETPQVPVETCWQKFNKNYMPTEHTLLFCRKYILNGIGFILLIIIAIIAIYAIIIAIGLFCVFFNTIFEKTMVALIGRELYNKNFPICAMSTYIGGNCYETKNIYCS